MRCVIARFPFDLFKNEVEDSMKGIKPEPVTGDAVVISRRVYPVKQVGEVITRQDRRDFSSAEVVRALSKLGFTCRTAESAVPAPPPPVPRWRRPPRFWGRRPRRGARLPERCPRPGPTGSETCFPAPRRRLRASRGVR